MSLKSWERSGKRVLTRAISRTVRRATSDEPIPDLATIERLLIVRQHNQLGDMLLGSPLLRAVRERAPHARIDLISGSFNHEAVRCSTRVSEVLLYDKARFMRRPLAAKRFVDRLVDARYDLALVAGSVSFSHTSVWLALASRARRRAGRPGPNGQGLEVARDMFDWVLPAPRDGRHQTGVALDLVAPFGASTPDWTPEMGLDPREAQAGRDELAKQIGARGDSLRIVMHPGAGKEPNRWPAQRFGQLARALRIRGHRVALAAGPRERTLLVRADAGAATTLPRLAPLSVHALAGAIADADFAIVNDTGVLHIAVAVRTPTLAFFGPTDPAIWCPASARAWTLRPSDGRLESLPSEVVGAAATGLLAHVAGQGPVPPGVRPAPSPVGPGGP